MGKPEKDTKGDPVPQLSSHSLAGKPDRPERVIVTANGVFHISGSDSRSRTASLNLPENDPESQRLTSRRGSLPPSAEFLRACDDLCPKVLQEREGSSSDGESDSSYGSATLHDAAKRGSSPTPRHCASDDEDDDNDDDYDSKTGSRLTERRVSFLDEDGTHDIAVFLDRLKKRRPSLKTSPKRPILKSS